jgi:Ca2+-binding RTX toxin-like protein
MFGNEGNDTLLMVTGNGTMFGGLGNDFIFGTIGRDSLQGNEGNDTLAGDTGGTTIDTVSGGSGNDVFLYSAASEDGNNAGGGGPVELVTDVSWAEDKFDTATNVTFAANLGPGTGANLATSANNAIAAALALSGNPATAWVAAQFTFAGRTYVAIDQAGRGAFVDTDDLLIDITGVTGTIATSSFI